MPQIEVHRESDRAAARVGATLATLRLADGSGEARLVAGNESTTISITADDAARTRELLSAALAAASGDVHWWVQGAGPEDDAIAGDFGLVPGRWLLQMRRPLSVGMGVAVATRSFRPGLDEQAVVDVNNRAFAGHPEQGGWSVETLTAREAEPWFDPEGFRLHERDDRLAAFCWTKLHHATADDPPMGEIYVIGVDPDFQGLGLGKQLTLAGLEWIAAQGVTTGLLYVDAANTTAVAMYERLGFTLHRTDRAYTTRKALSATNAPKSAPVI